VESIQPEVKNVIMGNLTQIAEIKTYLKRAEELGIDPNFYLSEPYLNLIGARCYVRMGWVWIEEGDWCVFPPLPLTLLSHLTPPYDQRKIWSDFEGKNPNYFHSTFLDWEYIFNPTHFNSLSGGKWETYRKNIRKWPKQHPNWEYSNIFVGEEVQKLIGEWLEDKKDDMQDADLLAMFILIPQTSGYAGIYRKFIYNSDESLVAINVWDENYKYINYRYCIVKDKNPYLDEFARYLFYTDPDIQSKGKLINDGGSIGNEGLEKFKDKLNPVRKREVHSWFI
jgi:hypothetical protein